MKDILLTSLQHSYSYEAYQKLVSALLAEGKSTGPHQSESLFNYSVLNDRRMKRLDKTITLSEELERTVAKIHTPVTWVVLSEGWCGDAAQVLPIIHKIAATNPKITLRIVLRDENEALMDQLLTNGSRSIPKLVGFNANFDVLYNWGPRPAEATQLAEAYKKDHGALDAEFKKDLQLWYTKNKGKAVQDDFITLIASHTL